MTLAIGFFVFPNVTQLDFTGPLQVLCRTPGATIHIVSRTMELVSSDAQLSIPPTITIDACPPLDVICVPGGHGVADVLADTASIDFVRRQGGQAKWVTSVCTGAFILGAAGLLKGRRATTHWAYKELLPLYGATPGASRVVRDGNLMTGGGVTAGIDFGLTLVAELSSPGVAQAIQLSLEYDPYPPFDAGHPRLAPVEVRESVEARVYREARERMRAAIEATL